MIRSMMDNEIWKKELELMRDQEHFEKVWNIVRSTLDNSINSYLDSIVFSNPVLKPRDSFNLHVKKLIDEHSIFQDKYAELFSPEKMEEYEMDVDGFKGDVLSKRCDTIRVALNSKAEALKDWRILYQQAAPQKLYDTFYNMICFAEEYKETMTEEMIDKIDSIKENGLSQMEEDSCYLGGVIGTGILSNILNAIYPRLFPGTFKVGMFSLYFLSGRRAIEMGSGSSEFLMIKDDVKSKTGIIETEYNYYYPYETFALFTLRIFRSLDKAVIERFGIKFPVEYRYVLTNDFYRYIFEQNKEYIQTLLGNDDILKFQQIPY